MGLRNKIALALLALVPVSIAAEQLDWGDTAVFFTSAAAILPLSLIHISEPTRPY